MNSAEVEDIVNGNIKLVYHTIKKYFTECIGDDDVFQIGCIAMYHAAKSYNANAGAFSTIAVKYMRHSILNHLKKSTAKKRSKEFEAYSLDICEEQRVRSKECVEDRIEIIMLNDAMKSLKDIEKTVLIMHVNGYTQTEIANKVGCNQGSVSRMIIKTRKQLKAYMGVRL